MQERDEIKNQTADFVTVNEVDCHPENRYDIWECPAIKADLQSAWIVLRKDFDCLLGDCEGLANVPSHRQCRWDVYLTKEHGEKLLELGILNNAMGSMTADHSLSAKVPKASGSISRSASEILDGRLQPIRLLAPQNVLEEVTG